MPCWAAKPWKIFGVVRLPDPVPLPLLGKLKLNVELPNDEPLPKEEPLPEESLPEDEPLPTEEPLTPPDANGGLPELVGNPETETTAELP